MNIVNRAFTPDGFAAYVKSLDLPHCGWTGTFPVLHNTAPPTLAMRPHGFTSQNMVDMGDFYAAKDWHAGPHLFIDDTAAGIHVFSDLRRPGVHSFNWNPVSYGVEQLGDYDTDDYTAGRGLAVQRNAVAALAVLCHFAGMDSHSLRLHKENTETDHKNCPGRSCADRKAQLQDDIHAYIVAHLL